MKKVISFFICVALICSCIPIANAEEIEAHYTNFTESIDGEYFLKDYLYRSYFPGVGDSYLDANDINIQDLDMLLTWFFGKETSVENTTKSAFINKVAEMLDLNKSQIEAFILKSIPAGNLSIKAVNYSLLCLLLHPLSSSYITTVRKATIIPYGTYIFVLESFKKDLLMDIEMLEWFCPTCIYFNAPSSILEQIEEAINEAGYEVFQNSICDFTYEKNGLYMNIAYTGSWIHMVALRRDLPIYDEEYLTKVEEFVNVFLKNSKLKKDSYKIGFTINNYLAQVLDYGKNDNSHSMAGAVLSKEGYCSCYADTFKFLTNMLGVECILASSKTARHQWNKIKIDGEWLNVDCMWDDHEPQPSQMFYAKNDEYYENLKHPLMEVTF